MVFDIFQRNFYSFSEKQIIVGKLLSDFSKNSKIEYDVLFCDNPKAISIQMKTV
jgi:hypothetical protein